MDTIPSPDTYERFTDWVIETSQATDIDTYRLWELRQLETEDEFVDWVKTVATKCNTSEQELILAADDIARESGLPNPPVPSLPINLDADGRNKGSKRSQTSSNDTTSISDGMNPKRETSVSTTGSSDINEQPTESGEPSEAATTKLNDTQFEEGPRFSDLTDTTEPGPDEQMGPTDSVTGTEVDSENMGTGYNSRPDAPSGDAFVTEAEYEQFQEKVQQIVQDLIDFLISYDMLSAEGSGNGNDTDLKQRLQQAAKEADDTADFFEQIEAILTDLQGETEVDFSEFSDSADASTEATKQPSVLTEKIENSVNELRKVQEDIESDSRTIENTKSRDSDRESNYEMNKQSRNNDPVILNRLNALTDIIRRETPSYGRDTDDIEPPDKRNENRQSKQGSQQTDKSNNSVSEQTSRESPTTPSGVAAATGAKATNTQQRDSEDIGFENIQDFGSIRQALLPIDIGWLFAALTYGGLDMFTTVLVLNDGGNELNPIFSILGESTIAFVIWKTLIIFMLFVIFYPENPRMPDTQEWLIPIATGLVGAFLTVNNLAVFITGSGLL